MVPATATGPITITIVPSAVELARVNGDLTNFHVINTVTQEEVACSIAGAGLQCSIAGPGQFRLAAVLDVPGGRGPGGTTIAAPAPATGAVGVATALPLPAAAPPGGPSIAAPAPATGAVGVATALPLTAAPAAGTGTTAVVASAPSASVTNTGQSVVPSTSGAAIAALAGPQQSLATPAPVQPARAPTAVLAAPATAATAAPPPVVQAAPQTAPNLPPTGSGGLLTNPKSKTTIAWPLLFAFAVLATGALAVLRTYRGSKRA
ncbi:MAG: hypothetical protein ACR2PL_24460 [Dehalococcoidia bacterium]